MNLVNHSANCVYALTHEITSDTWPMPKRAQTRPEIGNYQPSLGEGRAAQRYRLLALQLADDDAKKRGKRPGELAWGWQTRVAGQLGVEQPYLWQVLFDNAAPSSDAIELAIHETKISEAFFFGHFAKEPHYRNFRGAVSLRPPMGYPALQRFYDMNCFGQEPNEQERHLLERQEWEGEPTERTYDLFLQALRTVRGVEQTGVRPRSEPKKRRA